jgi:hypothetical protein
MNVSRYILVVDTSVLAKNIMDRVEYYILMREDITTTWLAQFLLPPIVVRKT